MTLYQAIRERGGDPESHLQEIADGNKRLDELGIVLDSDARRVSAAGLAQPPGTDAGGGDDADDASDAA
jgi:capsid protein